MRLRNRMVKASFWTDPDLLRWPRDKRHFYQSLWALAEDSCCLEDDMFAVKVAAWASPVDADITVEVLSGWRDELVAAGKLIPYESEGKRCLFLDDMRKHENPRNPQSPDIPLPEWIEWNRHASDARKGYYVFLQESYNACTKPPVLSCPVLSCTDLSCSVLPVVDPPVEKPQKPASAIEPVDKSKKPPKATA